MRPSPGRSPWQPRIRDSGGRPRGTLISWFLIASLAPTALLAQNSGSPLTNTEVARRLTEGPVVVSSAQDTRFQGDRTQRVMLDYGASSILIVKWASAPPGGDAFNSSPRRELASYVLQKLFLDDDAYVVPPTVVRSVPLATAQSVRAGTEATFRDTGSVLVELQYWLPSVSADNVWDKDRFQTDTTYARGVANLNIFTYLARHADSNQGNFLISTDPARPQVFAVDNGLTFGGEISDRGTAWMRLRVDRLPRETVWRLRALTHHDLEAALGVLAEWEIRDGMLVPVPPGENLSPGDGVRRSGNRVQIGLTSSEIRGIEGRLRSLLEHVDQGRLGLF